MRWIAILLTTAALAGCLLPSEDGCGSTTSHSGSQTHTGGTSTHTADSGSGSTTAGPAVGSDRNIGDHATDGGGTATTSSSGSRSSSGTGSACSYLLEVTADDVSSQAYPDRALDGTPAAAWNLSIRDAPVAATMTVPAAAGECNVTVTVAPGNSSGAPGMVLVTTGDAVASAMGVRGAGAAHVGDAQVAGSERRAPSGASVTKQGAAPLEVVVVAPSVAVGERAIDAVVQCSRSPEVTVSTTSSLLTFTMDDFRGGAGIRLEDTAWVHDASHPLSLESAATLTCIARNLEGTLRDDSMGLDWGLEGGRSWDLPKGNHTLHLRAHGQGAPDLQCATAAWT